MDVRNILPGGQWVKEVERAITSADFFLTFVSINTVDPTIRSESGFSVNSEVEIARKKFDRESAAEPELGPDPRSHFIPVRLDPVTPPTSISQFQWIDFFKADGQRHLIEVIRKIWTRGR
jgi:TIR domain